MKSVLLVLLLLSVHILSAQLVIGPGAQFSIAGNIQLTLQNINLVNNGSLTTGHSLFSFTGNGSSTISGSQALQFFELEIQKTNNSSVVLNRSIGLTERVLFTSGFLNLNGFNVDLGTTGHVDGEKDVTRVIGSNGGEMLFRSNLNAPIASNPANLGLFITTSQNLGNVTIKRGHQSQTNIQGGSAGMLRYYDILSENNANLNAILRIEYLDGELNGLGENSLTFFSSANTVDWSNLGFTSRDAAGNFVEKTGIASFGRFTLSTINNSLPVHFIVFNVKCEGDKVLVTWKTSQELNSNHFNIERSADGVRWTVIGNLPAAGNSSIERNYSFVDNGPAESNFYRIGQYDLDGRVQYTGILRSSCNVTDVFSVWPNPVHDLALINIVSSKESGAILKLFDIRGALVKQQRVTVLQGSNQISVTMKSLPNGIYSLFVNWNNGQMKKAVQVLKQ